MRVVIFACIFYTLFSFNFEFELTDFKLFGNDFNCQNVAEWLFFEFSLCMYLVFIALAYFSDLNKAFKDRLFMAVILEAIITLVRYTIYGYFEPFYIPIISNSIPLAFIIYSYLIYGNRSN